jgi:hypothetical protein
MRNILRLLRYFPQISALVGLLAVTFDVGYFAAIDLSFFTLFSLPEHLLFAIQALPLAFGVAALVIGALFSMRFIVPEVLKKIGS